MILQRDPSTQEGNIVRLNWRGWEQLVGFLRSMARPPWRLLKRTTHRLLHPIRRRLARRLAERIGTPQSVLFVCLGNICRSPYAARAIMRELPSSWGNLMRVDSAGFIGPNRPSPQNATEVATERGVDLSDHRSKLISSRLIDSNDLVVVMEPWQRRDVLRISNRRGVRVLVLGDLRPHPGEARAILDPFDGRRELFERSYDDVDACIEQLARIMTDSRL
jgi:protein-tyrosine-phosphatase